VFSRWPLLVRLDLPEVLVQRCANPFREGGRRHRVFKVLMEGYDPARPGKAPGNSGECSRLLGSDEA
jgi:hypothetical protein